MRTTNSSLAHWLFVVCGAWLIAQGVYFALFRPALLPEDARFLGASIDAIRSLPELSSWLHKVFTVLGGFMIATGTLTIASVTCSRNARSTVVPLTIAGISGVGLMCVVNFVIDSDYKWLLSLPAAAWLAASVAQSAETRASRKAAGKGVDHD